MLTRSKAEEALDELVDPHRTAKLGPYLADLWARRSYMWYVAQSNLRSQQMNTVLGNLWHLINPALQISVYYLIFGRILGVDRGVDNFILFLTTGLFTYTYTQRSTMAGANAIVGNMGLIRAIRFPRAMLPATAVLTNTLILVNSAVVLVLVAALTAEPFRWTWFLLPLMFIVQFVFNLGSSMIAARLTVHLRDTTQILPFLFRLGFYASGVLFNVDAYTPDKYRSWLALNPLYDFLTIARWCVLRTDVPPNVVPVSVIWTLAIFTAGLLWFRSGEDDFARE